MKNKIILISMLFFSQLIYSQQYIQLKAAIDTALKNNLSIKNSQLMVDYQKALLKSGYEIPKSTINSEFGQINSVYFDQKFTFNQSVLFPTVYKNYRNVNSKKVEFENLNLKLKDKDLKQKVTSKFYEIIQLQLLEKLLKNSDSIYNEVYVKTKLKFTLGENNIVELKNTENQKELISLQLFQIRSDIEIAQMEFQLLINTNSLLIPKEVNPKFNYVDQDSSKILNHPLLNIKLNETKMTELELKLEKRKMYPDFNFAYTNMSIQGTGADNNFYSKSFRFQSGQIGVSIPLFYGAQKSIINSMKIKEKITENEMNYEKIKLENDYKQVKQKLLIYMNELKKYEDVILINANNIIQSVTLQFVKGEIDYFQWSVWVNQNISIQRDYYEKLKSYNEEAIHYHYLINE